MIKSQASLDGWCRYILYTASCLQYLIQTNLNCIAPESIQLIKSALQSNVESHLISCLGSFATLKSEIFGLRSKARASAGAVQLFRELPGTFNFPEYSAKWGHYIFPFVLIMGEPVCTVDGGGTNAVSDGSFCHSQIAFEALYLFVRASHQVFPS